MIHKSLPAQRSVSFPPWRRRLAQLGLFGVLVLGGCLGTDTPVEAVSLNPAQELLRRSLDYHDPGGVWGREAIQLEWTSTRPDGAVGFTFAIELAPNGDFSMSGERKGHRLEYWVRNGEVWAGVDGTDQFTDEVREQMGLARDGGLFWRDYLGFLGGFPMCLQSPSVELAPEVLNVTLDGEAVLAFDVSFAPEVGKDIYTFYFEPESARLVGCRFYRDDPSQDGETILFEGESTANGMRLPLTRRWYMNADDRFLGTDEIRLDDR